MKSIPLTGFMGMWVMASALALACVTVPSLTAAEPAPAKANEPPAPTIKTRPVKVIVMGDLGPLAGVNIHRSVWTEAKFPPNADHITDANGEVTFEVPEQVSILRLWASKEGFVPMFANFDSKAMKGDPVPKEHTFTLEPGTVIGGFVRDESGAPIAGAKVEVSVDVRELGGRGIPCVNRWLAYGEDCLTTDERGFWKVSNAPAGDEWSFALRLRHQDHVDDVGWRSAHTGAPHTTAGLRAQTAVAVMDSGVKVSGSITGPDGRPVPRALVIWGDDPYNNSNPQEVWADDNGRYALPPLVAGPTLLTIVAEGFAPEMKVMELTAAADAPTPRHEENVRLHAGKTITLQIMDGAGKPVPQAKVNIAGWRGKTSLFNWRHSNVPYSKIPDQADEKGVYTWTWAPEDMVEFHCSKKGFERKEPVSYGPGTHSVTLHEKKL
ncbi:MAG: carboxypeptidase-like regulatory domain-containing protein [Prosthecobacter sp.]